MVTIISSTVTNSYGVPIGAQPCYTEDLYGEAQAARAGSVFVFFNVRDLEVRARDFEVELPSGAIEYSDPKLRQAAPMRATGKMELVTGSLGEIRASGHLAVEMEAECDRCLEAGKYPLDSDFELYYRPVEDGYGEEHSIDADEAQMGFYEGDGLELNDVLREFVLLTLPMQRLCREDCKGICPKCGQSRNLKQCDCTTAIVDARWSALQSLKK